MGLTIVKMAALANCTLLEVHDLIVPLGNISFFFFLLFLFDAVAVH